MDRIERITLNQFKNKVNVNSNFHLKQQFTHTHNLIPIEPMEEEVDISKQFSKERDEVNCYRFLGNLNIVASNVLFNWNGDYSYETILNYMDFDQGESDSTNEYVYTQGEILKEKNGWFYYLATCETNCNKEYLEPIPTRFPPLNLDGDSNWNVYLTYPKEINVKDLQFNGVSIEDGIAVYSGTTVMIDNRPMTAIICSINHGLSIGDEIVIKSNPIFPAVDTGYEGIFNIYALGFGDGTYETNTFVLDYVIPGGLLPTTFDNTRTSFKRRIEGYESEYYSRWFKKMTKINEVDLYNTAFATNIYRDQIYSFNFKNVQDTSELTDHLNRPLTEVYLSIIKKQDIYSNGDNVWTTVESGLNTVIYNSDYDINTLNSVSLIDSVEENVNGTSETFFGDIVEYNKISQIETILEVAYHRFNTLNRENNNFLEGYYYKPHYKNQIKKLSNYVQVKYSQTDDIPDYATSLDDGRNIWRDVLPNDFTNNNTISFLNGCHYIYQNINLFVKRQDPCNLYEIPNITVVSGNCVTNEQFVETTPTNNFCE